MHINVFYTRVDKNKVIAGKYTNHKGRNRRFTNPEELEEERRKEEQKKKWRQQKGESSSSEEEEDAATGDKKDSDESSEEEETSSDDEGVACSNNCKCFGIKYNHVAGESERCI